MLWWWNKVVVNLSANGVHLTLDHISVRSMSMLQSSVVFWCCLPDDRFLNDSWGV
jgi:hypothetical protein